MKGPKKLPVNTRVSFLYAERGYLEVDGNAVVLRQGDMLTHLPVGNACAVIVTPGTVVTHAAVKACAEEGTLLIWTGEHGVRCYAAGNPGGACATNLLHQAALRLDEEQRLMVAKRIYGRMFDEKPPQARNVEQLRGLEGSKVKVLYKQISEANGLAWTGRTIFASQCDPVNNAISHANAALYGLTEAVILALGYSPAIGFIHSGDPRSFVFDVADCVKFKTVVPLAMQVARESESDIEGRTRRACRDLFQTQSMANLLVHVIKDLLKNG